MTEKYRYITDTGAISADTADVKASVEGEYKLALGSSISLDPATPQGTLIAGETISRTDVMKNNAELANMINPNLAYGTFLDAICNLLGVERGENTSTIATGVTVTGNNLTVISANSRVTTTDGNVFLTVADVTIPISGTTSVSLKSQDAGPVPLPIGMLTITDGTIGWGTAEVTSGASITLGTLALQDPPLKNKRSQQLAKQGRGSSAAIRAAALSVPNVTSVQVVENNTGAAGVVNGVTFTKPKAFWVCIGGTPDLAALGQALYEAHNGGCPWDYGATGNGTPINPPNGLVATDSSTGLNYNVLATTSIKFDCYVHIKIGQGNSSASPDQAVKTAITSYASGQIAGELGFVVGASVSAFELSGAVTGQLPGLYVKDCRVAVVPAGAAAPAYPADYVLEAILNRFDQATVQTGNITVEPV